ncbi:MAG: hypothetical protein AAB699_02275 [Patescibacteria group bacterium]
MKKEFVPLIPPSERDEQAGNYGVSVANGSFGGGKVIGLSEDAEKVTVHFAPFASLVQGEVRGRLECEMPFPKKVGGERPPLSAGHHLVCCLIIEEGPESFLILYPRPEKVIADYRAAKKIA